MSSKATILITDDEKSIRNALKEILEFENYVTLEAENGEEALKVVEKENVNLVMLDIKMKGLSLIHI